MNIAHIIETALFLLIVFLIGAILGYFIRHLFFRPKPVVAKATTKTTASTTSPSPTPPSSTTSSAQATTASKPPASKPVVPPTRVKSESLASPDGKPKPLDGPRGGKKDDLKRIKGIGPKIEKTLNELGIYHFDQIAQWSPKSVDWINGFLSFKGRVQREKWIEQAKKLANEQID